MHNIQCWTDRQMAPQRQMPNIQCWTDRQMAPQMAPRAGQGISSCRYLWGPLTGMLAHDGHNTQGLPCHVVLLNMTRTRSYFCLVMPPLE